MKSLHVLTVLFVVLKLAEVISWSWWLVFLPSIIWLVPVTILLAMSLFLQVRIDTLSEKLKNLK